MIIYSVKGFSYFIDFILNTDLDSADCVPDQHHHQRGDADLSDDTSEIEIR